MKLTRSHISLVLASGFIFLSLIVNQLSNLVGNPHVEYFNSDKLIFGLLCVLCSWILIYYEQKFWIYFFTIVILGSYSNYISLIDYNITFRFFIPVDIFPTLLLIVHVVPNISSFKTAQSNEEKQLRTKENVDYYLDKYSKKSIEELHKMNPNHLTPEAREALNKILNS